VLLGVYPKPILGPIDMSVKKMISLMEYKASEPDTKDMLRRVNTIQEVR